MTENQINRSINLPTEQYTKQPKDQPTDRSTNQLRNYEFLSFSFKEPLKIFHSCCISAAQRVFPHTGKMSPTADDLEGIMKVNVPKQKRDTRNAINKD
jgi:hypothetical protein